LVKEDDIVVSFTNLASPNMLRAEIPNHLYLEPGCHREYGLPVQTILELTQIGAKTMFDFQWDKIETYCHAALSVSGGERCFIQPQQKIVGDTQYLLNGIYRNKEDDPVADRLDNDRVSSLVQYCVNNNQMQEFVKLYNEDPDIIKAQQNWIDQPRSMRMLLREQIYGI
jgi:hypothetical protein